MQLILNIQAKIEKQMIKSCKEEYLLVRSVRDNQVMKHKGVWQHFDISRYCLHHEMNLEYKQFLFGQLRVLQQLF
jgi:hypothetical protein